MLIEFIAGGPHPPVFRKGVTYEFRSDPEFNNAILCDVKDADAVADLLRHKRVDGKMMYRKFPLAAVRDPDFLRAIYRNPVAAIEALEVMLAAVKDGRAGELEVDTKGLEVELLQTSVDDLRTMATELGLLTYPNSPQWALLGTVMPYCKTALREAFPKPMAPTPEEQLQAEFDKPAKQAKKARAA